MDFKFKVVVLSCLFAFVRSDLLSLNEISLAKNPRNFSNTRIVDGHSAKVGQFPYIVLLECVTRDSVSVISFCGGSIINSNWILTAAHCVKAYYNLCSAPLYIAAGKYNKNIAEPNEQYMRVKKHIVHERYKPIPNISADDIALLQLEWPLQINNYVRPISLPLPYTEPEGYAVVSGWGSTDLQETFPDILQTVEVEIIDRETCNAIINLVSPKLITDIVDTNICTFAAHCGGDSGGPLTVKVGHKEELVGVVSWGFDCAVNMGPSVYAKVSDYVPWIIYNMNQN